MKMFSRKSMVKFFLNTVKKEGTPYSIAMGVALGLFVGFAVPIGGQIVVALLFAFMLKANKLLACIFTFLTNPYTVTFMYPFQCWFGSWVMGDPLDYDRLKTIFGELLKSISKQDADSSLSFLDRIVNAWTAMLDLGQEIVVPFFVAGFIWAFVSAIPSYFIMYRMVVKYREMKVSKIAARQTLIQTRKTQTISSSVSDSK